MKIRGKYNLIALAMTVMAAFLPYQTFAATYVPQAVAVSADLLSGTSASGIANFHYNLASLPAGSSVRLQFSKDNASWYSAGGASGEWTTISAIGGADLDLAAFVAAASWASGDSFYYKLELNATPDLTQTPAVEDIRLDYTPAAGYEKTFIFDDYGRVGIGTTAPWYTLDVNGTINADFYRVGGVAALGTTGGKVYVGSAADYDFGIYAGAADRLFIQNSTGNVGIGTTSPGSLLHLNGALGALSGGLAFGDGDTGLYENYDDNFRLQTAGVDRITIDDTGNVGIGTTAPSGLLHVAGGQCVTGDTLLRVRRRRKRQNERGEWIEEEYFEDCRIDQIKAGDEILTLDENTGRLTVSRVNALMDMGVKEIYKLTTATGKTIRTTANHPYLAVDGFDNERAAVFVDSANFEMSCRFCGLEKDYVKMDKFFFGAMKKSAKTFRFYKVDFGGNKQRKFFDFLNIIGAKIVSKPIKVIKQKQKANEHKANFDVELAVDAVELKEKYDTAIIVSGDSDFAYLAEHLQKAGKKTVVISPWRRTGKELRQQADMYFDLRNMPFVGRIKIKRPPVGGINPGFSPALTILSQVHPFVKGAGRWTKVSQLREGQMIAVAGDNAKPQYERIAEIEKLPAEQVYDIEVEGTHNFVGNGIVAHNTYLQGADQLNTSFALRVQDSAEADKFVVTNAGRVGIGTTSPAYTLDVNGGFRAGNATSTNALVLDPNTGNVGVGTASPVQKLHVEGHCITGDSELAIVSPPNQEEQIRKIQIKDVQPGTQVLTLNEQTNRLEARAINKLLDMGVQAVFRLTTSSGKTIRTTGNHPYLAKISSAEQQQRISLREIGAMEREYGIDKNGLSVDREFSQTKTIWAGESEIAATKKPACADSWTSSDSVQISGLSPNAIIADAPILSMAAASRRDFRVVEVGGIEPPNPWVTIQSSHRATPTTSELYHENDDGAKWTKVIYLSVGDEIATVSLDHRLSNSEPEVSWEKISSIEYVGQEQVYDIEVAGTHNFVANEILAHNTYISGNVGIGTASPAEALDVNGRVRLAQTTAPATVTDKLYNVSGNLLWNGIDLTSGGALPVGTEGQMLYNNAGAWTAFDGLYWDDTTSRLGIGTTAPIYKFNVAGANAGTDVGDASLLGIVNTDTTANNTIGFAFGQANLSGTIQTVAGIDLVGVSHADGAQSGALAFSTRNAGSWSERLRIDNTGNVGIGTTAPSGLLHVAGGQCVTGDTLLRVRRRRKRQNERGEWVEEEYFEDCRIDQIKAGDEILTLDENTGRLAVSRVNALMDMGVKEIYKLTTATGKTIRTTANHPYLARKPKTARTYAFIDASNIIYGCRQSGWRMDFKKLYSYLKNRFGASRIIYYAGEDLTNAKQQEFYSLLRKWGYELVIKPTKTYDDGNGKITKKANVDVDLTFEAMLYFGEYDRAVFFTGDGDFYRLIAHCEVNKQRVWLFGNARRTAKELKKLLGYRFSDLDDLRQKFEFIKQNEADPTIVSAPRFMGSSYQAQNCVSRGDDGQATKNPAFDGATSTPSMYLNEAPLVKGEMKKEKAPAKAEVALLPLLCGKRSSMSSDDGGRWTKVADICEGMEIATADENSGQAVWERIAKIEKLPAEQVYDIEVEGTHNFVGNGIVAHNTYLQGADQLNTSFALRVQDSAAADKFVVTNAGNVGIGTTAPGARLSVSGGGAIGSAYATTTVSDGNLIVSGNVGIGTTAPSTNFHVVGSALVTGNIQSSSVYTTTIYPYATTSDLTLKLRDTAYKFNFQDSSGNGLMTILGTGNVGIGTTTPGAKLDIVAGNLDLDNTTNANQFGAITKNGTLFIHDFNYGNNGTVTTAGYNTFIGSDAGNFTMGSTASETWHASFNTGVGANALFSNTTGYANAAFGSNALLSNTTGFNNFAMGNNAGRYYGSGTDANQASSNSLFVGYDTRANAAGGTNEIVIGASAIGAGSNSVVLGNDSITKTLLKGSVGIGTTGPDSPLHIVSSSNPVLKVERTTTGTSDVVTTAKMLAVTSGDMANGFGPAFVFSAKDSTSSAYDIGSFGAVRDGADNSGALVFRTPNAGTFAEAMRIDKSGNVGIGTTSPDSKLEVMANAVTGGENIAKFSVSDNATNYVSLYNNTSADGEFDPVFLGYNTSAARVPLAFIGSTPSGNDSGSVALVAFQARLSSKAVVANRPLFDFANYGTSVMRISSAGNVGIGTTSPAYTLDVNGGFRAGNATSTNALVFDPNTGNVGVGTASPGAKLEVDSGNILLDNTYGLRIKNTSGSPVGVITYNGSNETVLGGNSEINLKGSITLQPSGANDTVINIDSDTDLKVGSNNLWVVGSSGNVGIGTTAPWAKLAVDHTISVGTDSTHFGEMGWYGDGFLRISTMNYETPVLVNNNVYLSSGNVGIGTTGPGAKLDVNGDIFGRTKIRSDVFGSYGGSSGSARYAGGDQYPGGEITAYGGINALTPGILVFRTGTGEGQQSERVRIDSAGNVGIGTTSPAGILHTQISTLASTPLFERNGQTADNSYITSRFLTTKTTDMGDGFGSLIGFAIQDDAGVKNIIGDMGIVRSGSDTTGDIIFRPYVSGTPNERMRITSAGNVGIGTTAPATVLDVRSTGTSVANFSYAHTGTNITNINGINLSNTATTTNNWSGFLFSDTAGGSASAFFGAQFTDRTNHYGDIAFGTHAADGYLERLRITSTGNVGIGTTTPVEKLDVVGGSTFKGAATNGRRLTIHGDDNIGMWIASATDSANNSTYSAVASRWRISGAGHTFSTSVATAVGSPRTWDDRLVIDTSGNVGIGTTSPAYTLDVNGNVRGASAYFSGFSASTSGKAAYFAPYMNTANLILRLNDSAYDFSFQNASSTALMTVQGSTGNVGIGTTSPIYKFNLAGANASTDVGDASLLGIVNTDTTANNTIGLAFGQANLSGTIQTVAGIDLVGVSHADGAQSGALAFATRNAGSWSEKLRISEAGNVGIGTTSPGYKFTVQSEASEATLGSNVLTNGDFATNDFTGWTAGANWLAATGAAVHTAGAEAAISQDITVTTGKYYQIDYTETGDTAGTLTFAIGSASVARAYWAATSVTIKTTGSTGTQTFSITPSSDYNGTLDNITVRLVTPAATPAFALLNADGTVGGVQIKAGGSGLNNIFIGLNSGRQNTTGYYNNALGYYSLYSNTTGYSNNALGYASLYSNTSGNYNNALGANSLYSNTTGNYNNALGANSLYSNTTGYYNNALGASSLYSNTTGYYNNALGYQSLYSNTTGYHNNALGYASLYYNTSGGSNNALGVNSLYSNTTGNFNNALGYQSLYSNTTGNYNNALGREAGRYNETGSENNYFGYRAGGYGAGAVNSHSGTTAVGSYALYNLTTGNYNLGLGYKAGENLTSGSGNVIIGYDIDAPSATASNQLNIGNLIFGTGLDGRNGTLSSGNVGIGTTAPTGKLTVRGDSSGAVADLLRLENLGTAAVSSGAGVQFVMNRTTGGATEFGRLDMLATNIDNTAYSGALQFKIAANGLLETVAEFGSANIVLNRPLQVNVAGDTGISYDLQFMNTGVSNIVSNGPLTISAGTIYRADNLTLTTRANEQAGDFGTAATTTATTLTDSGKAWTADEWIGGTITIVAGAGKGQTQTITDNDATVITVADWDATLGDPSANSVYRLSYAPAGDVLANIANANAIFGGFKVLGNDNGGYAFRVAPDGSVHIGGEGAGESSLFVKQNITAYGGILSLRQLDISSAGTPVATTATSGGSCADSTAYYYKVTAINGNGETTGTAQFTVTTGASGTNINLNTIAWSAVTGATGYKIYRSTENNDWDGDANDQWVDGKVVAAPAITYDDDCAGDTASLVPPTANTTGGKLAINTAGVSPTRRFEVLENTGAAPQMKIISDSSNYSEFYVDATGDLSLKLTGSGGDDLILLDENLKICASGDFGSVSCPTAGFTISGTGNLIVENKVIADKFEQICPTGYVWVPGSAKHGTLPGFCVMKYEAKDAGGGVAESKAADAPWTSVTQENARAYCQALGEGYHLVSEAEWMTIAENIAATPINDIDAVAGLQLATGHTDNDPANSLAAGTDPVVSGCNLRLPLSDAANAFDADCQLRDNGGEVYGYSGTGGNFWNDIGYLAGGNNKSQLRVHALSNGNTVWDIAGNVYEWTDAIISQVDQPGISNDGGAGVANWGEWNVSYYLVGAAANSRPPDDGWTGANGIGRLYTYGRDETATTTYRAFLRGGDWNDTSYAGVFALNLSDSPATSHSNIGFRCAR